MNSVSIVKTFDGKERKTSILERYLPLYTKEGWRVVGEEPQGDNVEMQIISAETKEDIEKLIKDLYGVDLDKRLSLDNLKEKALAVINESKRVD